ncbi:MAG: aminodeoxychorismate/anthranilate synthase component II [Trueperaceae bacterium]
MIDNYDSFTYNLVQYLAELGSEVTVWRNDAFTWGELDALAPDAVVVSPGPCTPNEAGYTLPAIERLSGRVPLLGVCLGHQAIGQAFGGRVVRAPVIMHGKTSDVVHDGSGVFAGLRDGVTCTRYHSLVVQDPPAELLVNAWVDEADQRTIMGVRHAEHPTWGVQFHPESVLTEDGHAMLANFLAMARERRGVG